MYLPVMGAGAVEELQEEGGCFVSSEVCGVHGWGCVGCRSIRLCLAERAVETGCLRNIRFKEMRKMDGWKLREDSTLEAGDLGPLPAARTLAHPAARVLRGTDGALNCTHR